MRRATVLLLVTAALLAGVPAVSAAPDPDADGSSSSPRSRLGGEREALALLGAAARASASLSWSGTQYASSWRDGASTGAVVEVSHAPGVGTTVEAVPGQPVVVPSAVVDERLLDVLAAEYALSVAPGERCSGRSAQVVEARRGDDVAGRFWLDEDSGLVLRREVYDADGSRLRSTAFVDLVVGAPATGRTTSVVDDGAGRRVPDAELAELAWLPAAGLPGGHALLDARAKQHDGTEVLHLVWSDGLSTQSLFVQPGSLGGAPGEGYAEEQVAGARVWSLADGPERLVWSGGGQVFTLVSDAPPASARAAVAALPHDRPDDGVRARLGRGLGRIGSWINPFA